MLALVKQKLLPALLLVLGIVAGALVVRAALPQPVEAAQQEIALRQPQLDNVLMQSSLESEAGISAYVKTSNITLTGAGLLGKFRTIEAQTANYLIGSVAVATYNESQDVKVYVSKTGWVLAYYLAEDPTAKMVDIESFRATRRLSGSKLETALRSVLQGAGKPVASATFYDFRNPSATKLMLIGEYFNEAEREFTITPPALFVYYELSVIAKSDYNNSRVRINNADVLSFGSGNHYSALDVMKLNIGASNRFYCNDWINAAGVLALTYSE